MVEVSLLEYLAMKMNCEYLSDLRYGPVRKKRLRYLLSEKCSYASGEEAEWIEVCRYLTGEEKETGQQAYKRLLQFCEEDEIPLGSDKK